MTMRLFRVTIPYTESRPEKRDRPYQGTIEVYAPAPGAAKHLALREFRALAELSSAKWAREVIQDGIRVEAADEAAPSGLNLRMEHLGPGTALVEIDGILNAETCRDFGTALADLAGAGCTSAILDMSRLSYLNSTAIGTLVSANQDVRMLLVGVPQKVRRVMTMAGIDRILKVFDTRQEALASLSV